MKFFALTSVTGVVSKATISANLSTGSHRKLQNVLAPNMVPQNRFWLHLSSSSAHQIGRYRNALYRGKYSSAVLESKQDCNLLAFVPLVVDAISAILGDKKIAIVQQERFIHEAHASNQDLMNYVTNCRGADYLKSCADFLQVVLQAIFQAVFQDKRYIN
jgi:hypothetical protein